MSKPKASEVRTALEKAKYEQAMATKELKQDWQTLNKDLKQLGEEIESVSNHILHPANTPDLVNAPPHYRQGDIECIAAIKAALTPEEFRGYVKGNNLKYIWRERHKGGDQDLKKASWYLKQLD